MWLPPHMGATFAEITTSEVDKSLKNKATHSKVEFFKGPDG